MKNRGLKTLLSTLITASMICGSLVVPMAAEENGVLTDEMTQISADEEIPADTNDASQTGKADEVQDVQAGDEAEFETVLMEQEASVEGLDEIFDQVDEADVPWIDEEENVMGAYSVSADAARGDANFYGHVPLKVTPMHHDVELPDELALGAEVDETKYISPDWSGVIKDQGATGNCWAFSTVTALETETHKKTGVHPSLSWKNLSYWGSRKSDRNGEDALDYKDSVYSQTSYVSGYHNCIDDDTYYHFMGGNTVVAGVLFSQWRSMKDNVGADDSNAINVKDFDSVIATNTPAGSSYSDRYRVTDTYLLRGDPSNRATVKAMIVKYGAGTIAYYVGKGNSSMDGAVYNSEPPQGVQEGQDYSNHQITIIGWDDNYPASNFVKTPKGPGAWICANSWGIVDGTDHGKVYISYYDDSIVLGGIDFHEVYASGDPDGEEYFYDNNYGTNGASFFGSYTSSGAYAMAYTADSAQTLKAVSVFTYEDNAALTLSVYGNPKVNRGSIDINDGGENAPVVTQKVKVPYSGIHTVKLDKPVAMEAGQSVIISFRPDAETVIPCTYTDERTLDKPVTGEIDENSYYYAGNSHFHSETSNKCLSESEGGLLNIDDKRDFYIRAYTNDGIETGAVTFTGTDFDLSKVFTASEAANVCFIGDNYYQLLFSGAPFYTGKKHVETSVTRKSVTNDLTFAVKRNGKALTAGVDYKIKLKNNKFPSGYKGKNPEAVISLGKGSDKEEKKTLKKYPMSFDIRKANLNSDVYRITGHVATDPLTGKLVIKDVKFLDAKGDVLKFKVDKTGKGKKDVSASLFKYNGVTYVEFRGTGTTCEGVRYAQVVR